MKTFKLTHLLGLILISIISSACSQRFAVSVNNQTLLDPRPNDTVYRFADPGLQGCVNLALQQPNAELESITVLSCIGSEIESIEGIALLSSLQFLDLSNNRISSIAPLSGLKRLSSVSIGGNRLRDIEPLIQMNSLTSASLAGNPMISCAQLNTLAAKLGDNLRRPATCRE